MSNTGMYRRVIFLIIETDMIQSRKLGGGKKRGKSDCERDFVAYSETKADCPNILDKVAITQARIILEKKCEKLPRPHCILKYMEAKVSLGILIIKAHCYMIHLKNVPCNRLYRLSDHCLKTLIGLED